MAQSTWAEISNDPEFQKLSPAEQAEVKRHYAESVLPIDPDFQKLTPEDRDAVMSEFLGESGSPINYDQIESGKRQYQPWEVLPEMARNWGPDAVNALGGMWQSLIHPVESAQGAGRIVGGAGLNAVGALTPQVKELMLKQNPRLQEMVDAANAVGGHYAERYGSLDALVRTAIEHPAEFGMDASTLLIPAGGAVRAGANALRVPVAVRDAAAIATNPTRIVEGPVQAAGRGVRAAADAMDPQGQLLLRATEGQESQVLNALRANNNPVSQGTAGEVASGVGATQFSALDRAARRRFPSEATDIKDTQNTERLAQVRQIGGTPADLQAAIQAREAAAAPHYAAADAAVVTADDTLMGLFGRPSMDKVMARAREIAAERDVPFEVRPHTPAQQIPDPYGQNLPPIDVPEVLPQYRGDVLHIMKQAFDDLAYDPAIKNRYGIGESQINAIRDTRGQFLDWVDANNPSYGAARAEYAAHSPRIDQMRIGQYLESKLQNPTLGDDTMALRADSFSNALDNGLNEGLGNTNIRRATGQARYQHLRDVMTPGQMATLQRVQDDLARAKVTEEQARAASQYGNALNNSAPVVQAPGFLSAPTTVANFLSRLLSGHVSERVADRVGNAMLDPAEAAALLEQAINRQAQIERFSEHARRVGRAGQALNRVPAVYNALEAERRDRERYIP